MRDPRLSRRGFAGALGAAFGAALLETRIAGAAEAAAAADASGGPIRLDANENPYGPSDGARRAAEEALLRSANRYPDEAAREMRQAVAAHHGVALEQVVLGCGSSQILQMADASFLGTGRTLIAAEPTFEAVLRYAATFRDDAVKVPLTAEFRHDLEKMAAAADEKTGLIYVCNPNNPTGTVVGARELAAFVDRVPAAAVVLVDEAYHHFVEDRGYESALGLVARHPNVVVARTFSKIYGLAGMRLGYAVGSPAVIPRLAAFASWDNVNAAVLAAARASLEDKDLVPQRRRLLNDTRRWLCGELARDERRFIASETNFVMIDLGSDIAQAIRAFHARDIRVGRKFPSMPNWLRVSIGRREEMAAFVAALRQIAPARALAS